jgi:phosphoglycolate phosphatase
METYVFDLDGTLLDTLDDLTDAVNFALAACELPTRTREEVRAFIGNGIKTLMVRAVGETNADRAEETLRIFKVYYAEHCLDKTKPYDGVKETLAELLKRGKKIAVVSNKADFATKKLCLSLFPEIPVAIGENESAGVRKKPAPDAVLAALQALNAQKETAVYVGDSEVDIQTANNAGIPCVSVSWGFKDREFLLANGAMKIIDEPKELLDIE